MMDKDKLHLGRSHIETMRREITKLEFALISDGNTDFKPDAITCHRLLGNIVAQADAVTILVEDADHDILTGAANKPHSDVGPRV